MARSIDHRFLALNSTSPAQDLIRQIAVAIMNHYAKTTKSKNQWADQRVEVTSAEAGRSDSISVTMIERHLREKRTFDHLSFRLYPIQCHWLDANMEVKPRFLATSNSDPEQTLGFIVTSPIGGKFPLEPVIDREGTAFSSAQTATQIRIMDLRARLVERSNVFHENDWFQDLRAIFSELMSLVDMTMQQIYYKAKYNPDPGWMFDEDRLNRLAPLHGARARDKIRWVRNITGRTIEDISQEREAFDLIRVLRNHTSHWDPPCFAFALEEVAEWLNCVQLIGRLLWKIRKVVAAPLSSGLISMLLAPSVCFAPENAARPRAPIKKTCYASTVWAPEHFYKHPGTRVPSEYGDDEWSRLSADDQRSSWEHLRDLIQAAQDRVPRKSVGHLDAAHRNLEKIVQRLDS